MNSEIRERMKVKSLTYRDIMKTVLYGEETTEA